MQPMQSTPWRDPNRWLWALAGLFPGLVWLNLWRFEAPGKPTTFELQIVLTAD